MKQVNRDHYRFGSYVTCPRFISFWHQVNEALAFRPENVLEVGPGPGIVTDLIRREGVAVTTIDFADDVGADVVGSVLDLPFGDGEFDVVLCCQVLEHLPFDSFDKALSEIRRVARKGAVISLPRVGKFLVYVGHVPFYRRVKFGINWEFPWMRKEHVFDGQHYWEIGKRGYPISRVEAEIRKHFGDVRSFRLLENGYHHFFICGITELE